MAAVGTIKPRAHYDIVAMRDVIEVRVQADVGRDEPARAVVSSKEEPCAFLTTFMLDHAFLMVDECAGESFARESHLHWAATKEES